MIDAEKQLAIDSHSEKVDLLATYYREYDADPYVGCFSYGRKRLAAALAPYLPARGEQLRLLDLGCGTGYHLAELRARGFDAVGVDASEEMLQHARANNPGAEIVGADVEQVPFADASFDIVLCVEVLRYLRSSDLAIREMARVLKPGGRVLATASPLLTLQGYPLLNRIVLAVPIKGFTRLRQSFVTSRQLRRQFERAGFRDVRVHGVYWGPVNWVARLAPRALHDFLKRWEAIDARIADRPMAREFANMFLVSAVKS